MGCSSQLPNQDEALWQKGAELLSREFFDLSGTQRTGLSELLISVEKVKAEIVAISDRADGAAVCASCKGACCRVGRYHPTPLDVLAFSAAGENPVAPDTSTTACPFLGSSGCRIAPSRRPLICVIFICSMIEERLSGSDVSRLLQKEEELRRLYDQAAARYGRRLTASFILELERGGDKTPPFITTTHGG